MKIDFTTYTDEKLLNWIEIWETLPITRILYGKDKFKLYHNAIKESLKRGL